MVGRYITYLADFVVLIETRAVCLSLILANVPLAFDNVFPTLCLGLTGSLAA